MMCIADVQDVGMCSKGNLGMGVDLLLKVVLREKGKERECEILQIPTRVWESVRAFCL
jgi:hypothetical protein